MENQNQSNQEKKTTTINIQVPSADSIAKRRMIIPVSFALTIVLFFFTFCDFKCGGSKLDSVTGINLVTGTDHDIISGREIKGEEITVMYWAILAFCSSIVGLFVFVFNETRIKYIIAFYTGAIGAGSLLILQFFIKIIMNEKGKGQIDADFQFPYWSALLAYGIASFISYFRIQQLPERELNEITFKRQQRILKIISFTFIFGGFTTLIILFFTGFLK